MGYNEQLIIDDAEYITEALRSLGYGPTFVGLHQDAVNETLQKYYRCRLVDDEFKLVFENEADKLFFILKFSTGTNPDPNSVGYRGVVKYEVGYVNTPYIPLLKINVI